MPNAKRVVAIGLIAALLWGVWPHESQAAALLVEDLGVLAQAFMIVASLTEMIGLNVRDLQALSSLGPILAMIQQLQVLSQQLQQIAKQLEGERAGWQVIGSQPIPCSVRELRAVWGQSLQHSKNGTMTAMQIQGIVNQTVEILQTLINIAIIIPTIGGTTSGAQVISSMSALTVAQLQKLQVAIVGHQQQGLGVSLIDHILGLSQLCLQRNRFAGWGRYP